MDENKNNYQIFTVKDGLDVLRYEVTKDYTIIATFNCNRPDALSQEQALEDAKWYMSQKCDIKTNYDPCRKFKKGDLVKKRYIFGRSCDAIGSLGIYTVVEDEDTNGGNVIVKDSVNMRYKVKAVFLQLITPAEDRPVYSVQKSEDQDRFDIMRDDLCVMSFPFGPKEHGYYYNETAAKEDAEIECNRLNNLYKQELENNG